MTAAPAPHKMAGRRSVGNDGAIDRTPRRLSYFAIKQEIGMAWRQLS